MPPEQVLVFFLVLTVLLICCLCVVFCFERHRTVVPYLGGYGGDDGL